MGGPEEEAGEGDREGTHTRGSADAVGKRAGKGRTGQGGGGGSPPAGHAALHD